MAQFDAERVLGDHGSAGWILSAVEFPDLLDLVYMSHHGEVWLYNNDLRMLLEESFFKSLYKDRIADSLKNNIDAVKILVNNDCAHHLFEGNNGPSPRMLKQLKRIQEVGGSDRLSTLYFGKVSDATAYHKQLKPIPRRHTWVFYTHHAEISDKSYGFVIVRPSEYPFYDEKTKHHAIAWQMSKNNVLQPALVKELHACFSDERIFWHVQRISSRQPKFINGWSRATQRRREQREKSKIPETLAFGQTADIAILASRQDEIDYLKKLLKHSNKVPGRTEYESAAIRTQSGAWQRLLLAVIGEGNMIACGRTWDVISRWNPREIILMGVAGIDPKSQKPMDIGDVIVAEKVVDYEFGSIVDVKGRWSFKPRQASWGANQRLFTVADKLCRTWPKGVRIKGQPEGVVKVPKSRVGVVGSGSKVVESPDYFLSHIRSSDMKVDTVETEAAGVCCASDGHQSGSRKVLVVRGIMDRCDSQTRGPIRKEYRLYATRTCAQFVYDLLHEL